MNIRKRILSLKYFSSVVFVVNNFSKMHCLDANIFNIVKCKEWYLFKTKRNTIRRRRST